MSDMCRNEWDQQSFREFADRGIQRVGWLADQELRTTMKTDRTNYDLIWTYYPMERGGVQNRPLVPLSSSLQENVTCTVNICTPPSGQKLVAISLKLSVPLVQSAGVPGIDIPRTWFFKVFLDYWIDFCKHNSSFMQGRSCPTADLAIAKFFFCSVKVIWDQSF